MMKKVLIAALAALMCLSLLSACSSGSKESAAPSKAVESIQPTQEPSEAAESVQPTKEPAQGGGADLAAFVQAVLEGHEFPAMNRADPDDDGVGAAMLANYYPGLTDLELAQVEVYLATISFSGGELAVVEGKTGGDAAKAKEIFQARIDAKTTDGPGNYPEEVETWQRSAKVAESGNYVLLVCHDDSEAIVQEFNALFK